jgi:hypothetical protein
MSTPKQKQSSWYIKKKTMYITSIRHFLMSFWKQKKKMEVLHTVWSFTLLCGNNIHILRHNSVQYEKLSLLHQKNLLKKKPKALHISLVKIKQKLIIQKNTQVRKRNPPKYTSWKKVCTINLSSANFSTMWNQSISAGNFLADPHRFVNKFCRTKSLTASFLHVHKVCTFLVV